MVGRQLRRGARDGGLHVLRGGVDIAAQIKLKRDLRAAERAGGRHRVDARDGGELFFERRGDGGRHGVGIRAGQTSR